jgi:hypothetical protein
MEAQKTPNYQRNPEQKKSNAGDITIRDFRFYCRAIVTKISWHWHKTDL